MITGAQLDIYERFNGDVDLWQHHRMPGSDVITFDDWGTIDVLRQELAMYKHGVISEGYAMRIRGRLAQLAADPETAKRLLELA
ncbi:MAG: hypothetical protein JSS29_06755 [Proteobacteria bacterium]|nr:hypothetical protein [Pseudomonadota bacterium]